MATLVLTGNAGALLRLCKTLQGVCGSAAENKNVTFTLDDSDFSVTYTDGAYGSQKQKHK